jgi:hypothetical protein
VGTSLAALYLRIRTATGGWTFARSVSTSKGQIRPLYALVSGKPTHCPDGIYYLRYRQAGNRVWQAIGNDASLAAVALQRKQLELQAELLGMPMAAGPELSPIASPQPKEPVSLRSLSRCIADYLAEVQEHKADKTLQAYSVTMRQFAQAVKVEHIEDVTREDVLAFASFLRKRGNAPRTVRNRIDYVHIFLRHFGLPALFFVHRSAGAGGAVRLLE